MFGLGATVAGRLAGLPGTCLRGGELLKRRRLDQFPIAALIPWPARVGFSLIANALVTPLISIVYFYPTYSTKLLVLGFPWAITAPAFMLMLAIMLRRRQSPIATT